MARARNSGQGGYRQGTPGKQYGNRTDLNANRAQANTGILTPASGGIVPPSPARPAPNPPGGGAGVAGAPSLGSPGAAVVDPDHVTPLDAPTNRPNEPVTSGLPFGPGPGPAPGDQNRTDLLALQKYLPILLAAARNPTTPASVIAFVNYLQSQI